MLRDNVPLAAHRRRMLARRLGLLSTRSRDAPVMMRGRAIGAAGLTTSTANAISLIAGAHCSR